ncbi:lysine histidine transporter 1-like [Salvia divinorum]|uniref:Lysine histidine transporter 1-like n=1 Tax=Salvia divinorum TaxID=28513 RepID=A0ABD1FYG3_SALDI
MVEMHEMVPGKRFDRYHELGRHTFGEKLGLYIVVPQQLVVKVDVNMVYMVTGGKSLKKFHETVCGSCNYSTIAWAASIHKGVQKGVEYSYPASRRAGKFFDFFTALGEVAFVYAGHNVVLEIQATIPSTIEKPQKAHVERMFGNQVQDNILLSLEKPAWLIAAANMFVVIHVIGNYQIYAMPVFDMIKTMLVKTLRFKPSFWLRFTSRNI